MYLKSLILPALTAATMFGAPALADDAQVRAVEIDRSALSTEDGARRTYDAIEAAARAACRAENRGGAAFARSMRICTEDTVKRTVEAINAPALSALLDRRSDPIALASSS